MYDRYNLGEITKETIKERLMDTVRMSVYNSFITVKYNRLASPLENAPQASFQIDALAESFPFSLASLGSILKSDVSLIMPNGHSM